MHSVLLRCPQSRAATPKPLPLPLQTWTYPIPAHTPHPTPPPHPRLWSCLLAALLWSSSRRLPGEATRDLNTLTSFSSVPVFSYQNNSLAAPNQMPEPQELIPRADSRLEKSVRWRWKAMQEPASFCTHWKQEVGLLLLLLPSRTPFTSYTCTLCIHVYTLRSTNLSQNRTWGSYLPYYCNEFRVLSSRDQEPAWKAETRETLSSVGLNTAILLVSQYAD
jgi:hypothetical protein